MFTFANAWRITRHILLVTACASAIAMPTAMAQGPAPFRIVPNALLSIDQNRSTVVERIVSEWGESLAATNAGLTVEQLRATLLAMRADYLLAASIAGSLDGLRNVVASSLIGSAPAPAKLIHAKALGDAADDLVYTPVTPCRIVDTVAAGGAITGLTARSFVGTTATNFTAQGGSATNCGIVLNAAALQTVATVVSPPAQGFLLIYPFNTQPTTAFTLVYPANSITTTAVTIPLTKGQAFEFTAFMEKTAFLQVDVVGYFAAPVATALQCAQVASASTSILVSSDTLVALPSCAAGYTRTGSQCAGTAGVPGGYLIETNATGCLFRNLSSVTTYNATATSTCCRIPGR